MRRVSNTVFFWTVESKSQRTSVRVAEVGSISARAKMAIKIFVKRVFTIFAKNASFLHVIANLQYMQYIRCNSVLFAQKTPLT